MDRTDPTAGQIEEQTPNPTNQPSLELEQRAFKLICPLFKDCIEPTQKTSLEQIGEMVVGYSEKDQYCQLRTGSSYKDGTDTLYLFKATPAMSQISIRECRPIPNNKSALEYIWHKDEVLIANNNIRSLVDILIAIRDVRQLNQKPELSVEEKMQLDILNPYTKSKFIAYIKSLKPVGNTI